MQLQAYTAQHKHCSFQQQSYMAQGPPHFPSLTGTAIVGRSANLGSASGAALIPTYSQ